MSLTNFIGSVMLPRPFQTKDRDDYNFINPIKWGVDEFGSSFYY